MEHEQPIKILHLGEHPCSGAAVQPRRGPVGHADTLDRAFDGGGIRGLSSLLILGRIMEIRDRARKTACGPLSKSEILAR